MIVKSGGRQLTDWSTLKRTPAPPVGINLLRSQSYHRVDPARALRRPIRGGKRRQHQGPSGAGEDDRITDRDLAQHACERTRQISRRAGVRVGSVVSG